jgi:hypothetical protein
VNISAYCRRLLCVGFQISTKNKNLVEDHPMNISGKFGSILNSGFREDLNVKAYNARQTSSDGKCSHDLWPDEVKSQWKGKKEIKLALTLFKDIFYSTKFYCRFKSM